MLGSILFMLSGQLVWGDHLMSMARLTKCEQGNIHSPISEAWANQDLCTEVILPYNNFNVPGKCFQDTCESHLILNASATARGKPAKIKKQCDARKALLEASSSMLPTLQTTSLWSMMPLSPLG